MTSHSPAKRIKELMLELQAERDNATVAFITQVKTLAASSAQMHDFEVFPPGIAEEARSLYNYLTEACDRLTKLASASAAKNGLYLSPKSD